MKAKSLKEYILLLQEKDLLAEEKIDFDPATKEVGYVSYNSMDVKDSTLFICKGKEFKKEYLQDAMEKGAFCYVAESVIIPDVPYILVKDIRKVISLISGFFYDNEWNEKLGMIGITGTKGKTTTTFFVKSIMDAMSERLGQNPIGLMGGVYSYDGETTQKMNKITTPEALELHRHLDSCIKNDCKYFVMETSSQGLKYNRTDALNYKAAAFLNIEEDHISPIEHQDMEDYFLSKAKIVDQTEVICVNLEMEEGYRDRILEDVKKKGVRLVTFGRRPEADIYGFDIDAKIDTIELSVRIFDETCRIKINIGGFYNVDNALGAIALATVCGATAEDIKEGLCKVKVPGRMEVMTLPHKDVIVVMDYAHNDMSYRALFDSINIACPERKKTFIFGCVGERAYNRREKAGKLANKVADKIIITEDDYGTESFEKICSEIVAHIAPEKDLHIIQDRQEAVRYGLDTAEDGWIVVMAGYASGNILKRGDKLCHVPCDLDTVKEYIEKLNVSSRLCP